MSSRIKENSMTLGTDRDLHGATFTGKQSIVVKFSRTDSEVENIGNAQLYAPLQPTSLQHKCGTQTKLQ